MGVFLQVTDGSRTERRFSIREGQNLIGRWDPGSGAFPDIDLDFLDEDARVSRKHATIEMSGAELSIVDMGSLNGTILNRVIHLEEGKSYPLQEGDEILVGKVSLRIALK